MATDREHAVSSDRTYLHRGRIRAPDARRSPQCILTDVERRLRSMWEREVAHVRIGGSAVSQPCAAPWWPHLDRHMHGKPQGLKLVLDLIRDELRCPATVRAHEGSDA